MIYLDTGVIVRALLTDLPEHECCIQQINRRAVASCHSLAEVFNTLTGFFKIPNDDASNLIESLPSKMRFEPLAEIDYLTVVREAKKHGIQGGIVYDALHAQIAPRLMVEKV